MKYIRNILIAFCLCFISCGNSSATYKEKTGVKIEEVNQIVKEASHSLEQKVEAMNADLQNTISEIQKKQEIKTKGVNQWVVYSWLLFITSIVVWLVYCWNKTPEKKDYSKLESKILSLEKKLDMFLKNQEQDITRSKNIIVRDNDAIQLQIQELLQRMLKLEKTTNKISENKNSETPRVDIPKKEGYFGMVKGKGVFNDEYSSKQDKCKFKVYYNSNSNEAEFDLIDLNRIRSLDSIEKAIEFDMSEVSLEDASHYEVVKKGLVCKNGDIWDIERKVKVVLKK